MWEKRTVWEAGTRVPAMVHVPPQSRGKRSGAPIELIDIYPTLIDVMGVPSPDATNTWPLEGVSLRPILEDPMLPTLPTLPTRKLARSTYARCPKVGGPLYDDVCIHVVERSAFGNMGYTIRTTRWRFTAWMHWDVAKLAPLSIVPFAVELYDHENDVPGSGKWERVDDFEDKSVHASAPPALLANLTNTLVAAFGLQTPSKKRLSLKTTDWRMLDAATPYPNHYVTRKLTAAESASMVVDGKLDESAWQNAAFTYDIVDITRHKNQQLNAIPNDLQMRVKIRWDDNYFYVGAILHESYVTAQNVGHNNAPPYKPDNDFEIFIDPSGTTQVGGCLTAACYSHSARQTDLFTFTVLHGVRDELSERNLRHQMGQARRHTGPRVRRARGLLAGSADLREHQLHRLRWKLDYGNQAAPRPDVRPAQELHHGSARLHQAGAHEREPHHRQPRRHRLARCGGGHGHGDGDGLGPFRVRPPQIPVLAVVR